MSFNNGSGNNSNNNSSNGLSGPQLLPGSKAVGGYLWKKSPSGIRGFRKWQKRWFEINDKAINYWKEKEEHDRGEKPLGVIPLLQIIDAQYLPAKRIGCRLDVRVKNMRVYSLHGTDPDDAKRWTIVINEAMQRAKHWDAGPVRRLSSGANMQRTKLQKLLYKYKFDNGASDAVTPPSHEEHRRVTLMHQVWPTDAAVLKYLLHDIMDPKKGLFIFDLSDDSQPRRDSKPRRESEDQKEGEPHVGSPHNSSSPVSDRPGSGHYQHRQHELALRASERRCHVGNCTNMSVGGLLYCPYHYQERGGERATGQHHADHMILEMLKSKEFVRTVVEVFATNDELAHGYAVRVLWVLFRGTYPRKEAAKQFAQYVEIYCSGPKFNVPIKQALVAILLSTPQQVTENVDKPIVVSFYMPVRHALTWPALFNCVKGCDFSSRISALQDVNTILHDNLENGRSIIAVENWQSWIFPLFCDLPKATENEEYQKDVYLYCLSVFTSVHFQFFMKTDEFDQLMNTTLYRLHQFGGSTSECVEIARVILASFVSKLTTQKNVWHKNDKSTYDWRNLQNLCTILRKFVFTTAYWQTKNINYAEDDSDTKPLLHLSLSSVPETSRLVRDSSQRSLYSDATNPLSTRSHYEIPNSARSNYSDGPSSSRSNVESTIDAYGAGTPSLGPRVVSTNKKGPDEFLLSKNRVGKNDHSWYDEIEITDYGMHWAEDGNANDLPLISKILSLFKALNLHDFNPSLSPNMLPKEREYMSWALKEYEFWQDTHGLLSMVTRHDIEIRKVMTYRKVSFLVQDFLSASSSRKSVFSELHSLLHSKTSITQISGPTLDRTTANMDNLRPLNQLDSSTFFDPVLGPSPVRSHASPRHTPRTLSGFQPSLISPTQTRKHQGSLSSGNIPPITGLNGTPIVGTWQQQGPPPRLVTSNSQNSLPSSSPSSTSSSSSMMSTPTPIALSHLDTYPQSDRDSLASNGSHTVPMHHSSSSSQHASSVASSTSSYMQLSGSLQWGTGDSPAFSSSQGTRPSSFILPASSPALQGQSSSSASSSYTRPAGISSASPSLSSSPPSSATSPIYTPVGGNTPLSPRTNHLLMSSPPFKGVPPPPPPGATDGASKFPPAATSSILSRTTSSPVVTTRPSGPTPPPTSSPKVSTAASTRPIPIASSTSTSSSSSSSGSNTPRQPLGSGGYPQRSASPPPPPSGSPPHTTSNSPSSITPPSYSPTHSPSSSHMSAMIKDLAIAQKKRIPPPPSTPPPGH